MKDATYYNSIQDGTEYSTDPKPIQPEALAARKVAIRDGRLRVIDREEAGTQVDGECFGCECTVPESKMALFGGDLNYTGLSPMPVNSDGHYQVTYGGLFAPSLVGTNEDGVELLLRIEGVKMVPVNGKCHSVEGDCVQSVACSFSVTVTIWAGLDGPFSDMPNLDFTHPVTGAPLASGVSPVVATDSAESSSGTYEISFTVTPSCGTSVEFTIAWATINPEDNLAEFSFLLPQGGTPCRVTCAPCTEGECGCGA